MKRVYIYSIPHEYAGHKISEFLRHQGYSEQSLTVLRHAGYDSMIADGMPLHMNHRLAGGEKLEVVLVETASSEKIPPVELPIDIVYEDEDLLVVNKPARMPIHPSMKNYYNSLGNAVMYHMLHISPEMNDMSNGAFVYRCINRLDRDTTGLTIIAKNMIVAGMLYEQMKSRRIRRTYTAIVSGNVDDYNSFPTPSASQDRIQYYKEADGWRTIDLPLGRKPGSTVERAVDIKKGDPAVTHFKLIDFFGDIDASLVECHLDTGRTHQIRVHMTAIGHPLLGDFLYNPDDRRLERQALHAGRLEFTHPITHEAMCFEVPMPEDMQSLL